MVQWQRHKLSISRQANENAWNEVVHPGRRPVRSAEQTRGEPAKVEGRQGESPRTARSMADSNVAARSARREIAAYAWPRQRKQIPTAFPRRCAPAQRPSGASGRKYREVVFPPACPRSRPAHDVAC